MDNSSLTRGLRQVKPPIGTFLEKTGLLKTLTFDLVGVMIGPSLELKKGEAPLNVSLSLCGQTPKRWMYETR